MTTKRIGQSPLIGALLAMALATSAEAADCQKEGSFSA